MRTRRRLRPNDDQNLRAVPPSIGRDHQSTQQAPQGNPGARAKCPFANLPEAKGGRWGQGLTKAKMADYRWVKPVLVGQFEFLNGRATITFGTRDSSASGRTRMPAMSDGNRGTRASAGNRITTSGRVATHPFISPLLRTRGTDAARSEAIRSRRQDRVGRRRFFRRRGDESLPIDPRQRCQGSGRLRRGLA